jgi:hypothetical protein
MRAGLVWSVAAVSGLVAFGSTLINRAPSPPPVRGLGGVSGARTADGSGGIPLFPPSLATLELVSAESRDLGQRFWLARRYEWVGRLRDASRAWRDVARTAETILHQGRSGRAMAPAHLALAEARRSLGDGDSGESSFREALLVYERRAAERPSEGLHFRAGWCCFRLGDEAGMARHFQACEELIGQRDIPPMESLYLLAVMRSLRGYNGQSLGALQIMETFHFRDAEMLEGAEEFANIREDPMYRALIRRLSETTTLGG